MHGLRLVSTPPRNSAGIATRGCDRSRVIAMKAARFALILLTPADYPAHSKAYTPFVPAAYARLPSTRMRDISSSSPTRTRGRDPVTVVRSTAISAPLTQGTSRARRPQIAVLPNEPAPPLTDQYRAPVLSLNACTCVSV